MSLVARMDGTGSSQSQVAGLVCSTKQGDTQARERLLAMYRPYLRLRVGQRLPRFMHKRADGSDIVQQTLVDAVRGLPDFRGQTEGEFTAWMLKLLERNLLQTIRLNTTAKRDVRLEMGEVPNADSAQLIWFSATTDESSPMSKIIRGEAALQLCEALESLPEDQRIAVEMRYIEQQSLLAIAAVMDRSVGSVAGLIHRGVESLHTYLPSELVEDF